RDGVWFPRAVTFLAHSLPQCVSRSISRAIRRQAQMSSSFNRITIVATMTAVLAVCSQASAQSVDAERRIQQLENRLRQLTGQNEELNYRNRQLEDRLRMLQGGAQAAPGGTLGWTALGWLAPPGSPVPPASLTLSSPVSHRPHRCSPVRPTGSRRMSNRRSPRQRRS